MNILHIEAPQAIAERIAAWGRVADHSTLAARPPGWAARGGAVLLSRAINDQHLSKQFLKAAAESVLMASSASGAQQGSLQ